MALTAVITKGTVTRAGMDKLWNVSMTLTLTDDDGPGLTTTVSQQYRAGGDLAELPPGYIAEFQTAIDQYKTDRVLFNHAKFAAAVVAVQAGVKV